MASEAVTGPTAETWIAALAASHERLAALVAGMDEDGLLSRSYDDDWSIGQVLSHLGSQAEIFGGFLEAGLTGAPAPGVEAFHPVWDRWNAKTPVQWRDDCLAATRAHVDRLLSLDAGARASWRLAFFGMDADLADFVRIRLSEHAVHTWDVAVALDPAAVVSADAVALMLPWLGGTAGRSGKPVGDAFAVRVGTTDPAGAFVVRVGESVALDPAEADDRYDGSVDLTAENLLRLVYGRLDPEHTGPHRESGGRGLTDLRAVLRGF